MSLLMRVRLGLGEFQRAAGSGVEISPHGTGLRPE